MTHGIIRLENDKKPCTACGGRKHSMMYDVTNDVWEKRPCTLCRGTGFLPARREGKRPWTNSTGPR